MNNALLCPQCGRPLDEHNRDLRFELPDPVLIVPKSDLEQRTWGNDVMMAVEGVGAFVRALLPVRLTGGYSIRYGLWLGVPEEELNKAYEVWQQEAYRDLVLNGLIANAIPPWGDSIFGAPAQATVRDSEHLPYVTGTGNAALTKVIEGEWDHEYVLDPWAGILG